jgi:polyisoprenoid-binding protein YceI
MKNLKSIALALVVLVSTATVNAQIKKIDVSKSKIEWIGKKITGQHSGNVNFNEGYIAFKKEKLSGGNFTVNMTTLTATDLTGEYKDKLDGHLKADDFFGTEKFPTATLNFKKIAAKSSTLYVVTADLTIKGITKPVIFDLTVKGNLATTTFNINRTVYDIKYGSKSFFDTIGDKAIDDEFEVKVSLNF